MSALTKPVTEHDHIEGSADAPVTLVEYGDYECPHCGAAHPVVQELLRRAGNRVRFVFRNFPLAEIHPHAQLAAEAAEAAGAQGQFWKMHDTLLTHQNALGSVHLKQYAGHLGIDVDQFTEALTAHSFQHRVREDFMSGVRSGVNGTPSFFINGARYDGPAVLEMMLSAIEEAAA
ncbi:MAG: thioredoxin domain-containing protein [Acidobacteriota bacterium]